METTTSCFTKVWLTELDLKLGNWLFFCHLNITVNKRLMINKMHILYLMLISNLKFIYITTLYFRIDGNKLSLLPPIYISTKYFFIDFIFLVYYNAYTLGGIVMEEIFKIGNNYLDEYQKKIVVDESKALLVVAGAGSGKTFTILGKIKYLIEKLGVNEEKILCISLTNDTVNNLKNKLNDLGYTIDVKTFHKLGLDILRMNNSNITICSDNYLDFIINEYFSSYIFSDGRAKREFLNYLGCNKNFLTCKNYTNLKSIICTAIHLIKNNNIEFNYLINLYKKSFFDRNVLLWIMQIYQIYKQELEASGLIDFDDMIIESAKLVYDNKINLGYDYIIIDEYQDTSYARYMLIKEIINVCNAKLMVVGDDFQSIYRFTGCELEIFLDFQKYFNNAKIMYLENTYRNSQELISIAGEFIMKNKRQIKKKLVSSKKNSKPIKIVKSNKKDILDKLIKYIDSDDIMILGRNNYDIKDYNLTDNYRYLTVHKSKGLEAKEVILINLEKKIDGFPNQKKDIRVLTKIKKNVVSYPFDEERRLFYVALTRTKNNVYLVVPKHNKSIFVKELIRDYKDFIEFLTL